MKSKSQKRRAGRGKSLRENENFLLRTRSQTLRARAQAQAQASAPASAPALAKAPQQDTDTTFQGAGTPTSSRHGTGPGKQGIMKLRSSKRILKAKDPSQNHKATEFFPVRRSMRKNRGELRTEARIKLNEMIKSGKEEGMRVGLFDGKGRGVITTKPFRRGDYVVEYHGDLINLADAKKREACYAKNPATGCYMYYFHYLSKGYCVDATKESGRLGRLINHSKSGNCQTKLHPIDGIPHLIVIATRDIEVGEELLYDYGDRSKSSLEAYPWLKY